MPTQRFWNLKEEKRTAILKAAFHEFSRTSYSSASINQIIKEAEISRGSFYTYFKDKDDLMGCLVTDFKERGRKRILEALDWCRGDPFEAVCYLLQEIMEDQAPGESYDLYKNALMELNVVHQNQLLGLENLGSRNGEQLPFVRELLSHMDRRCFPVENEERAACLLELMFVIGIKAVTAYYMGAAKKTAILKSARNQMHILKSGAFA